MKGSKSPLSMRDKSNLDPKSDRNLNKTNPFTPELGITQQTGDDQKQQQETFNDQGGWLPILARRQVRKALFDTELMIPGMKDPGQGYGAPWMGAGEVNPRDPEEMKKRDWSFETDKTRTQRLYIRNNKRKVQEPSVTDEYNEGVTDLSSESTS